MDSPAHIKYSVPFLVIRERYLGELSFGDVRESLIWPLGKPINGAAVEKRRVHAQAGAEEVGSR